MRYVIVLIAMLILLAVTGVTSAAVLFDRVVAVVNQEVITWSELYKNMEADASPQVKELSEAERLKVFKSGEPVFLEALINVRLQIQEARAGGFSVSDDEINESIEGIKKKYVMSDTEFRESLKKEGLDYEDYKTRLREQILISKIVNHQVKSKILVSDADIDGFLAENKEFSTGTEGFRISQIFFKKPKASNDGKGVEERAESVYKRIRDGADFKELAKQFSEEPQGASGGDLGMIKKNHIMKEFAEVLSVMNQGGVSRPFWTERGLHIIRLDEKIAAKEKSEVREEARRELNGRIFMERYNAWLKSLREKAFIEIKL
ncbi:MAG: peptidylprolyl isomerase [Nitrospirae bacterium]|nr:peptidylprolyl isomerase [Nitrospirota bacterium]